MIKLQEEKAVSKTVLALILMVAVTLASIATAVYYATNPPVSHPTEEKILVIYHWWTAGGEREAIDALFNDFKTEYPGVTIIDNPAAGGGGAVMRAAVKAMIMGGQYPDTFQVTYGPGMCASWAPYAQPIDDIVASTPIPDSLKSWGKVGDHYYFVPLNIHRDNNLWYNIKLVNELNITMPLNTVDDFFAACDKIKASGKTPFAFGTGSGQRFWLDYLFEWFVLVAPHGGADYLANFYAGKAHPATDPAVSEALGYLQKLFQNYVNPDYGALTWDEAGKMLMRDEAVFNYMGDWQKGMFMSSGWKPYVDFGFQTAPGTQGTTICHGDSFGLSLGAPHPTTTKEFLTVVASAKGEHDFCIIKGATPPRTDVSMNDFDQMQQDIAHLVKTDRIISGGHGVREDWFDKFGEILESYITSWDKNSTINAIASLYSGITW